MNPTLIINRCDSKCGNCGLGASPREKRHDTTLGYYASDAVKPEPCHIEWTKVTTDYTGSEMERSVRSMRPDLEWVGICAGSY